MPKSPALKELTEDLHVSHSQIFTYLNCSLKYKFQYVENRRFERISSNLFLGSAIHTCIERYYKSPFALTFRIPLLSTRYTS